MIIKVTVQGITPIIINKFTDAAAIKAASDDLSRNLSAIGEATYKSAQGGQAADQSQESDLGADHDKNKEQGTRDAEFEEK